MKLAVVGINHKTAPVEIREKLSVNPKDIVDANRRLKEHASLEEGLILSTCNRVEVYLVDNPEDSDHITKIKHFLSEFHDVDSSDFEDALYVHKNEEAVKHLFKVASGLDSMVIGEMEILGQVKKAYQYASESGTSGKILNRLLQKSFNAAKKIRTKTSITRGSVSVSAVAIKLARKILGTLPDKEVLIVGAGKVGEQLVMHLKKNGIKSILVANRTFENTRSLVERFGATAIRFEDFQNSLLDVDIVITSTDAPHPIIREQDVRKLMPGRKQKPLFIIDLAVPRDVDPEINEIDNVYLYNVDDVKKIVDENITLRKNELDSCQKIIDTSCLRFMDWLASGNKGYKPACEAAQVRS